MNRAEFLKTLGLGASGLILPQKLLLKLPIKIYDNYVMGLQHYDYQKVKDYISVGDKLILKREKTNIHDAFAVEVYYENYKIGYLPAYENIVIANMLEANVELWANVSYFFDEANSYKMTTLGIEIFAEMITPTPQLLTELQNKRASDVEDIYRQGYQF